jgi:hypothetical protein
MNYRSILTVALLGTLPLQANASDASPERQELLKRLHAQHDQMQSNRRSTPLRRPDLTPLVGLDRTQLASTLGAPDYCDLPNEHECRLSLHWAYFFYPWQPSAHQTSAGITEVRIPMGGWAVEVNFSKEGAVIAASWVEQR